MEFLNQREEVGEPYQQQVGQRSHFLLHLQAEEGEEWRIQPEVGEGELLEEARWHWLRQAVEGARYVKQQAGVLQLQLSLVRLCPFLCPSRQVQSHLQQHQQPGAEEEVECLTQREEVGRQIP